MEIHLIVQDQQYCLETIEAWQYVWKILCDMSYSAGNIQTELRTKPGSFEVDDEVMMDSDEQQQSKFYGQRYPINDELLTLDYMWKAYSQRAGAGFVPRVVPELKSIHVPACLFYTLGVDQWFSHSFPNCKVTYWKM
jgi:hypothetical protein